MNTPPPMNEPMQAKPSCCAQPKYDRKVQQARLSTAPIQTQKDTAWCINIWRRNGERLVTAQRESSLWYLHTVTPTLQYYLSCFVLEVRKKDGTEYPPDTLYHIVCGVMRFLCQNGKPEHVLRTHTHCYKWTSQEQHEVLSDMANLAIPGPATKQKTRLLTAQKGLHVLRIHSR